MHIMHMHIMHEPLFETLFGTALPKRVVKMRVNRAVNIPASQAGETGSIPATCSFFIRGVVGLTASLFIFRQLDLGGLRRNECWICGFCGDLCGSLCLRKEAQI